jgi:hypothetical protein
MLRKKTFDHGFAQSDWDRAKEEAREIMIECAKARRTISYSELVNQIRSIRLDPHDVRLGSLSWRDIFGRRIRFV